MPVDQDVVLPKRGRIVRDSSARQDMADEVDVAEWQLASSFLSGETAFTGKPEA